jgi:hypothetical protein
MVMSVYPGPQDRDRYKLRLEMHERMKAAKPLFTPEQRELMRKRYEINEAEPHTEDEWNRYGFLLLKGERAKPVRDNLYGVDQCLDCRCLLVPAEELEKVVEPSLTK